mmetsp:Transcript_13542/g.33259  ORF Transcript_13542/g.33259 Transcript_13542/m.33259 type:complete len:80 (+) Transcript_13542:54-293(+)
MFVQSSVVIIIQHEAGADFASTTAQELLLSSLKKAFCIHFSTCFTCSLKKITDVQRETAKSKKIDFAFENLYQLQVYRK